MKYLKEADISGEKLTHMTHIEDMLLSGEKAARFAYSTLLSIVSVLKGDTPESEIRIAIKCDGSPSCVAGSDFHGQRFVATKGFFAKDRKIAYTPEDCDTYFGHAPDLARKMKLLLGLLDEIRIPQNEIWQGDFLYDKSSLKKLVVDGEECISFHPNTIVYAVPLSDPLATTIMNSTIGVMWHTRYTGPDFDNVKIDFDLDADDLQKTPNAFCMDTYVRSVAGKADFTQEETAVLRGKLQELRSLLKQLEQSGALEAISSNSDLKLYLSTFENYEIKNFATQLAKPATEYVADLVAWVKARFDKEIEAKKQPKTKEAYEAKKLEALNMLDSMKEDLVALVEAQKLVVDIKEAIIKKMNNLGSFKSLINTLDRGYLPVGQEGFAINDSDGNIHKLVSRLEFSFNNFSKDVIKGWMSDKRMQEAADRSVVSVGFSFPKELKAVSDIHFPSQLQGVLNSFGRGVIDNNYRVVIGPIGSSHAGLQKNMTGARRFYFGYSKPLQKVFVVAKNSIDADFLRQPKALQIILSNVFDMLRLHVAGGKKLQFTEKSNTSVPELQAAVIDKAKQTDDSRSLVQALNALDALDIKQLELIVKSKAEVPGLQNDLLKELVNSNQFLENTEYVSLLKKIVEQGLLNIPPVGRRVNYVEEIHEAVRAMAPTIGISAEEAVEAVDYLQENLMSMTKPQSGTSVGKGELMFAMFIKGGAKRIVGDLDIGGDDIEVKGTGARLAGSSQQGGVESHSSVGLKLRDVVKKLVDPAIYERAPALRQSTAFNLSIKGCPALAEILPMLKEDNKVAFAEAYVDAMMSMAPQAPKNNRFRMPMVEAVLDGNIAELYLNYIMFHYDAYQTAAGWKKMLIFDEAKHLMLLLEKPEDLRKAVEDGALKAMPFSFSSVEGKTTAEPQKGWQLYLYEPGKNPEERKAASEQAKLDKTRAQLSDKIGKLSQLIEDKEATLESMPPAKRRKAEEVISRYKTQLEAFRRQLKELMG